MKFTAYENRKSTDALLALEDGAWHYEGHLADAIHYIEKAQLLDPALWSLFVEQFRIGDVDDENLGWRCEYWGKMMRGACFTYEYTQNPALYQVLEDTVRDLMTTQDRFGRISTYSVPREFHGWDIWGRKYVMLGLQYFLEICRDNGLSEQILAVLRRHADYLVAKIGNDEVGKIPVTYTSEWWDGLNASSILEPFVRLYHLTGDKKYLEFSKKIIDAGGTRNFNIFEAALEGKKHPYEFPVTKAYEMISNFEGIVEYYRATGEEKYRTMALNFARLVRESDITVIGSAGTTHELFDHSRVRQFNPAFNGIMQETCVTVTWMKFCFQLLSLTGDSVYADEMERSIYNGLIGAINVNGHPCQGQVFNFDSYSPLLNGRRGRQVGGRMDIIRGRFWWGCCVAIGAAGTGLIGLSSAMKTKEGGLAVNLYLPGEVNTVLGDGTEVCLHTETAYPEDGRVKITVRPAREKKFALLLRIPAWSTKTELYVCGQEYAAVAGSYARVEREWKAGDAVELRFDMRVRVIRALDIDPDADEASRCHAALQRGPVMLARDSQFDEDVREAVKLKTEKDGDAEYAEAIPSETASFPVKEEFRISADNGFFTVCDYASAGQNWDPEKPITVWITTKEN